MKPDGARFNLFGLNLEQMKKVIEDLGEKPFRAKQIHAWIYQKRVTRFEDMSDLPKKLRRRMCEGFEISPLTRPRKYTSVDGSVKYVFEVGPGQEIEAVYMPMEKGSTLCLSSQVGCAQACSFCLTAQMGFMRNLTPGEIVGQAYAIARDQRLAGPFNVVMMGMGEPLLNLHNLFKALDIFIDELGFDLSPKRITVSTSGHVRNLRLLGGYARLPRIAVSLNATTDEQRNQLMPVNLKWSIRELIDACGELPIPPRDKLTIEYVLIKGVNDCPSDARRLVKLLGSLRCKINLIPFNETEGLPYRQPSGSAIEDFRATLNRSRILNMVRWSRGRDIGAACGQLATPVTHGGPGPRKNLNGRMSSV